MPDRPDDLLPVVVGPFDGVRQQISAAQAGIMRRDLALIEGGSARVITGGKDHQGIHAPTVRLVHDALDINSRYVCRGEFQRDQRAAVRPTNCSCQRLLAQSINLTARPP